MSQPKGLIQKRVNIHRQLEYNAKKIEFLEQQLIATQKLTTIGTMSCMVAHEFNNLLTPIITYSQLAMKYPDDMELAQKTIHKIIKHANQAALIVQSMLGLVRSTDQTQEKTNLTELIKDCFSCLARNLSKDSITVKTDIDPDLTINVIRNQFQQILLNLIINARQAMLEKGGTLRISACNDNDRTVKILVSDTGSGITTENIDHIFEPFFTTKNNTRNPDLQGTGLGLMVCRHIVEAHEGTISVTSTPQQGATFTITIPA
jgi:two-component system NtrC family sensor kinase